MEKLKTCAESCRCHVDEHEQGHRTDRIRIKGLDCADCAESLMKSIRMAGGVEKADLNFSAAMLTVEHHGSLNDIIKLISDAGYEASFDGTRTDSFEIEGMDCADCAVKLERYLAGMPGVTCARVNFAAALLTVEHTTGKDKIEKAISGMGYTYKTVGNGKKEEPFYRKHRRTVSAALAGIGLLSGMAATFLALPWFIPYLCFAFAILAGGFYVFRSAIYSLRAITPDMNLLMTIAVAGAILINLWEEAAAVIFLFSVGYALQSYTLDRTRNSIKSLISLTPDEATLLENGKERRVPAKEIRPGNIIVIRPGERIAADGTVISGASTVNQAPITGESMPVEKSQGSPVYAGTMNERGTLEIRAEATFEDNTLTRIVHMVEEAQGRKAPAQEFVDRFAKYYTPFVMVLAVGIAIIPPIFGAPFNMWFYRALMLLVIACPCALVISTPVSFVAAIGNASRHGVLIKGGSYLEEFSRVKAIAFDKTGTLTEGRPEVVDVVTYGCSIPEAMHIAAALEHRSEHPLADAIVRANGAEGIVKVESFESVTGTGIKARANGVDYCIGNERMFDSLPEDVLATMAAFREAGKTPVVLGGPKGVIAVFAIMDRVRETSPIAIKSLHDAHISHLVMLTGDNEMAAKAIARRTGVDEYYAELLPGDKVSRIAALKKQYGTVAMVGDGVNDAPALAEASVGIAMGATGSDTAIETADIALMSNDLTKLEYLARLGRRTMGVIWQNVTFSLVIKLVFIVLTLMGLSNLWLAMFADTGAAIIVILNGMRLLK